MRFKILFAFKMCLIFLNALYAADFYVSPGGNDNNPGTKEKPFLTIQKAIVELEKLPSADYIIWLEDGIFRIEKPLEFGAKLSGSNRKIEILATKNSNPIVSGGREIKEWAKNKNGLWESNLDKDIFFRELFIENTRAKRARFPNEGFMRVKEVGDDRRTHFYFEKKEFPEPENIGDVELVLLHDWSISRIGVREIDFNKGKLTAVDSIGAKNPAFFNLDHWEKNPRYFLENDLTFLDADYEWYFDSSKNKVYLKIPDNEHPNNLEIYYPVSKGLIEISGVSNIHFEGITFMHCAWEIPAMGYCGVQACHFDSRPKKHGWTVVPAAIKVDWSENISFSNCEFSNLGTSGLWFSTACMNCSVVNSHFSDISGNGIMIGEGRDRLSDGNPWWKEVPEQVALGNRIENCTISNCGSQFFGAVGIWCGLTAETIIRNNHVFELPYTGISIGWMWSPVPTPCRDNVIDGNHIHHILKILSDGGGIYSLGLQPGSRLINNHIHDVKINAGRAESNGMFLDEGTTDVIVSNNLIYNIARSPLRFHKATTNLVKENHLFCTAENPPIRYNRTAEEDILKVDNKVFKDSEIDFTATLQKVITEWKGTN